MSRVEINAGGRQIVVDHETELEHITKAAQQLWEATGSAEGRPGPAVGFAFGQRHERPPLGTMRRGPGRVDAELGDE